MKLVSYRLTTALGEYVRIGALVGDSIVDLNLAYARYLSESGSTGSFRNGPIRDFHRRSQGHSTGILDHHPERVRHSAHRASLPGRRVLRRHDIVEGQAQLYESVLGS